MSLEELVSKYIASAEHVLDEIEIVEPRFSISADTTTTVVDSAKAYLEDAKYYKGLKNFEVSLTSIAYCEGLLDALRLIGAVRFEWSTKPRTEKEKQF